MSAVFAYIDDEPALCRIFELIVGRTGATVHTFTEPERALVFLASHPVDAVACDYRMPSMTGLELLDRLQVKVTFHLISGELAIRDHVGADPRVSGVLVKPFKPEALLRLLAGDTSQDPSQT
jgi:CheY-like chemotaxis protein